ncbi:hypothetical protein VU00_10095 [Candidatus Electrothrix marina]|uniref:Uncharacterized protein n=1 Tax=Candidatus Electrothrix marina TaxID=1859130 RepID=A0A3S3SUR0_9BACT|nr:hypothetical protein VU00_10095 [Candidatus Electrothrix marina]
MFLEKLIILALATPLFISSGTQNGLSPFQRLPLLMIKKKITHQRSVPTNKHGYQIMTGKVGTSDLLPCPEDEPDDYSEKKPVAPITGTISQQNKVETQETVAARGVPGRKGVPSCCVNRDRVQHSDIGLYPVKKVQIPRTVDMSELFSYADQNRSCCRGDKKKRAESCDMDGTVFSD